MKNVQPDYQGKFRVGYHWPRSEVQSGGIARYVRNITKHINNSEVEFTNYAKLPGFSGAFINRLIFFYDLINPIGIRRLKMDVYWGPAHKLPLFRTKGVPYILTIHDLVWKNCPHTMPLARRLTERFFFPIAIRNADVILAVSRSTADDIARFYPSHATKVKVTPLAGILDNQADIAAPIDEDKRYILFVGTIEPRKNIENMLKAYAALPKELKGRYRFYIVGATGWGAVNIEERVSELGLTQFVEWKPVVSDQELVKLYQDAYCLLFPSLYEGFGLPILEAQSFGIPVITSNNSSMPEVVGEGGVLVDPNSVESIKNALKNLLDNTGLRNSLSQKAKENSLNYSWEKTSRATCQAFFDSLI